MWWLLMAAVAAAPLEWPASLEGGWNRDGEVVSYSPDTLFEYIDGEAEIYYPYGFKQLQSVTYTRTAEPPQTLVADIYEMGSLLDAFGIYSNYRRPDAEKAPVGAESYISSTQVMFYQDRYFVRLAKSGKAEVSKADLAAVARAVASRLPQKTNPPQELGLLRVEGVTPGTEKYIAQSVLGYSCFPRGFVADAKANDKDARVFVVPFDSDAEALKGLDAYESQVKENGGSAQRNGNTLVAQDPLHDRVVLRLNQTHLNGVAGVENEEAARPLLDGLERIVEAPKG